MLVSMTVRNIALIEHLEIAFGKGMHVLSGETGAGKSIIVDSINLMLGERADRGLIRSGCEKASVEAFIDISDCRSAAELLRQQELEADGSIISIQREISVSGRNVCRVCGVIVPLAFLKALTQQLIDIHGQHEHQSLLNSQNHMAFLDSFGGDDFHSRLVQVEKAYHAWRESSSRFSALRKENAQRTERQAYLQNRVRELDSAALEMGEADRLAAEKSRFASAE
ncbi:MAG: AAA family ATPase, partial [Clostridia bacterium]|nr:AAA family ATPase [Clostridia bacterium]